MLVFQLLACTASPEPSEVAPSPVSSGPEAVEASDEPAPSPQYCRRVPDEPDDACWHALGGLFAHGACSDDGQCCDGSFGAPRSCGECACTETSGHEGCVPAENGSERCFAPYTHNVEPLSAALRDTMTGKTFEEGCPVSLDELALLTTAHWGFDGSEKSGQLVVRADLAPVYAEVLQHAWQVGFPIERMELASVYGGSDKASMAVNNTSAFNCRPVTGGSSYSQHSFGHAIDINPRQNPYVSASGRTVLPPEGASFVTRDASVPGLIVDPGPIVGAFRRHGWGWGGGWSSLKDYQHFSENGL